MTAPAFGWKMVLWFSHTSDIPIHGKDLELDDL